jgi:hypothetical protein
MAWQDVTVTYDRGFLRVSGSVDYIDIHNAIRFHFGNLRGWDTWTVTTQRKGEPVERTLREPLLTNADAVQLSLFWSGEMLKSPRAHRLLDGRRARWVAAAREVNQLTRGKRPDEPYPKHRELWREMRAIAITNDTEREIVDPERGALDLVVGFFTEAVPAGVASALSWVGDKLEAGAHTAGRAVGGAARGAVTGAGLGPILIGAGVLAGALVLVPKLTRKNGKGGAS